MIEKDIKGFEGLYRVREDGLVFSVRKNIYLKPNPCYNRKYVYVQLYKDKRYYKRIHKLVAETFIPNPYNYNQINHKDENPKNNRVENLEWCDSKYNNNYGTVNQRRSETVKEIWKRKRAETEQL